MEDLLNDATPGWVENKNVFERPSWYELPMIGLWALQTKDEFDWKEKYRHPLLW